MMDDLPYLGSIRLSPESTTVNRATGPILHQRSAVRKLGAQFEGDYRLRTRGL
jgi:hypothetical protein